MTCRDVTSFLLEYVAGELPAHVVGPFDAHLAECENCRVFLDQYRKAIAAGRLALGDATTAEAPSELVQAIVNALAIARQS